MPTKFQVTVHGGKELERAFLSLANDAAVRRGITREQKAVLRPVAETARSKAPKDTGDLADSIDVFKVRGGMHDSVVAMGPSKDQFHGHFQEFGHQLRIAGGARSMPAQPFMRPAWDQHQRGVLRNFTTQLWSLYERAARRARRR